MGLWFYLRMVRIELHRDPDDGAPGRGRRPLPAPPHRHVRRPRAGRVQRLPRRTQRARARPAEQHPWPLTGRTGPRLRAGDRRGAAALPRDGQRRRRPADPAHLRRRPAEVLRPTCREPVVVLGTAHGWLYALFFLSAVDLALRAKWTLKGSALDHPGGHHALPVLLRRAQRPRGRPAPASASDPADPPLPHPEDLRLMCGLLAYFSTDADRVDDATVDRRCGRPSTACATAARTRTRPGADDRAVFGFNRLSFIDIEHSHQPMPYADGRYRIVFNGEIYNYLELRAELAAAGATFATEGDTEAIVAGYHLWGEDVVPKLRGMFAFVIWDTADAHGVRRPRPVRDQAAVHRAAGRRRDRLRLGEEGAARAARRQQGRRRRRPGVPAALPDAAVRARARDPAPGHPPDRERHELHASWTASCARSATSTRRSRSGRSPKDEEQALYDRIADVLDDSVAHAHARRRHGRARSSPAASTRPPSPPWPSGTTRSC